MTKPTTPKPVAIPRDLKCGDMLKLSTGDVAIVRNSHCSDMQSPYHDDGCITADPQNPLYRGRNVWNEDGTAWGGSRLWVVRIIRKTSKPARVDRDAKWLLELVAEGRHKLTPSAAKRLRAIARRLSGEGKL